jgi:ATP-dependent protease HslVU (ClpYQ) peptidase subunit
MLTVVFLMNLNKKNKWKICLFNNIIHKTVTVLNHVLIAHAGVENHNHLITLIVVFIVTLNKIYSSLHCFDFKMYRDNYSDKYIKKSENLSTNRELRNRSEYIF